MYVEKYLPHVGKESAPNKQYVSSADVKRFALAVGETDPACFDEEYAAKTEYGALVAPPTYSVTMNFLPIPGVWIAPNGRIHAMQEFKYYKPIIAEREYTCIKKFTKAYEKEGKNGIMVFTEFENNVFDADMNLCVTAVITTITRGSLFAGYTEETEQQAEEKKEHTAAVDAASLQIGDELPVYELNKLSRARIARYAGASGDFNTIHLDDEAAQSVNFKRIVAHGLFSMGMGASVINYWFGGAGKCKITNYKARFASPAYREDSPVCTATVSHVDHENKAVAINFAISSAEGELIMSGSAEVTYF